MIKDQFDVLYEDGAKTGRVMSICLHPFLMAILIAANISMMRSSTLFPAEGMGPARGSDIIDWYRNQVQAR